ncbi:MAG: glycine zipper 2TM domain-containing protein [Pseudomonadota bacterium]
MNAKFRKWTVVASVATLMAGCAAQPPVGTAMTDAERAKAKKDCITHYTVVGSIGGAFLGLLTSGRKDRGSGALLGAVAGGALGAALAWGHCMKLYSNLDSYPVADARETARLTGYQPAKGKQVKIQSFLVDPVSTAPGREVRLNGSYYVMAPDESREVKVVETRTVSYYDESERTWKELGSVDAQLTAALGTRKAEGRFELPPDVPEGRYRLAFKVDALGRSDEVSQEIMVRKG